VLKRVHVDSHKALHTAKMQLLATRSGLDILERASADFYSKSTGLAKLIVLGIILGMGIGVGSCFLLNNWSNTLKNTIDIKRQFHLSIMGAIPHWNNDEKYIDEMEPDSQIAEVYSVLRNNIRFSPLRGAEKSLLVVSPSQSEGKTLTAINLALSFALEGSSCLLISADLRRPYTLTQFRQTKDTKRTKGICEYLNEEANIDDAIFKSNFNNLDLVPTCARAKNPTKLLKSERFKALVEKGKADYDIVIIDSPAILPVVDTSIISSHVNAALFVAKADKTATHDIENSLSRLEHVNCPIVGIALNGIKDLKLEAFYGYGRSQYSGYYT
jgi:capsular exopolysaccharide synthesis family protein